MLGWLLRIASLAIAVILGVGATGAACAAPALWVVRDADSEIYLFGTLHALSPEARWRTPLYDTAYAKAEVIWFEADLEQATPSVVGDIVQRYGIDPKRPLSGKLAPQDLSALARHVDVRRVDHLRPWAAALMLSMQPVLGRGASVEAGADYTLTRAARSEPKEVRAFETLEDQARLYAELPEAAEVRYLADVLREREQGVRMRRRGAPASLEEAWLRGDLARLGAEMVRDMRQANPPLYEALLRRRNAAWTEALARALEGSGVGLVNVGALHLVGQDGLPALLAARGFTVSRIQ